MTSSASSSTTDSPSIYEVCPKFQLEGRMLTLFKWLEKSSLFFIWEYGMDKIKAALDEDSWMAYFYERWEIKFKIKLQDERRRKMRFLKTSRRCTNLPKHVHHPRNYLGTIEGSYKWIQPPWTDQEKGFCQLLFSQCQPIFSSNVCH